MMLMRYVNSLLVCPRCLRYTSKLSQWSQQEPMPEFARAECFYLMVPVLYTTMCPIAVRTKSISFLTHGNYAMNVVTANDETTWCQRQFSTGLWLWRTHHPTSISLPLQVMTWPEVYHVHKCSYLPQRVQGSISTRQMLHRLNPKRHHQQSMSIMQCHLCKCSGALWHNGNTNIPHVHT